MEVMQLIKEVQARRQNVVFTMACRLAVAMTDRLSFCNRSLISQPSLFSKHQRVGEHKNLGWLVWVS
jgi:hypothetical protein